jgi:pSer/pThr/pTyr-binding forkhead associated (FHA) protein
MADPAEAGAEDRTQVATHNVYVTCDDAVPSRLPIASAPITIGRQDTCDIVLANGRVSRQHCQLQRRGLVVEITDLGSANGTFLDGKRIPPHTPTAWNPESELRIPPYTLNLEI